MYRKLLALTLSGLLIQLAAGPVQAQTGGAGEARRVERVRAKIGTLGTGESARVRVTLRDRKKVSGYVREAGAEEFVVVEPKTGVVTTVPYSQVRKVNPRELPRAARVAIGLGIGMGIGILFGHILVRAIE
ncbi:MAG TPA: hypothetical protein VN282_27020 [Pyrinomonadaceae bacterium]|nr:hypothetical protein [Pyrinomonadaceae bacterium]